MLHRFVLDASDMIFGVGRATVTGISDRNGNAESKGSSLRLGELTSFPPLCEVAWVFVLARSFSFKTQGWGGRRSWTKKLESIGGEWSFQVRSTGIRSAHGGLEQVMSGMAGIDRFPT